MTIQISRGEIVRFLRRFQIVAFILFQLLLCIGVRGQIGKTPVYKGDKDLSSDEVKLVEVIIKADLEESEPYPSVGWMPIGMFCVNEKQMIKEFAGTSFNILQSYPLTWQSVEEILDYLNEADRWGLGVTMNPAGLHTEKGKPGSDETAFLKIHTLKGHPAIKAWYIGDEPELRALPPSRFRDVHDYCISETPKIPTWIVIHRVDNRNFTYDYWGAANVKGIDPYVYDRPLDHIRNVTDHAKAVYPEKPIWTVVETHAKNENTPFPSTAKIRAMTYDAIIQGATGIFYWGYYCSKDPIWRLKKYPEQLEETERLARELAEWTPWILEAPIVDQQPGGDLHLVLRRQGNEYLVFMVNAYAGDLAMKITFDLAGMPVNMTEYQLGKEIVLTNSTVTDTLERWGVRIFQFKI